MTPEELMLLKETIKNMREGNLTKKEEIIFVIGVQAGLYSDDKTIKELLNEVADICLDATDRYIEVKTFDN